MVNIIQTAHTTHCQGLFTLSFSLASLLTLPNPRRVGQWPDHVRSLMSQAVVQDSHSTGAVIESYCHTNAAQQPPSGLTCNRIILTHLRVVWGQPSPGLSLAEPATSHGWGAGLPLRAPPFPGASGRLLRLVSLRGWGRKREASAPAGGSSERLAWPGYSVSPALVQSQASLWLDPHHWRLGHSLSL